MPVQQRHMFSHAYVGRSAGFRLSDIETGYMNGPKLMTFMYQGQAIPEPAGGSQRLTRNRGRQGRSVPVVTRALGSKERRIDPNGKY
jgi:hypothetical protein